MKDKILEEFDDLIKDLVSELIKEKNESSEFYSDSIDKALTKAVSARRSYAYKKANDQRIADLKKQNPDKNPGNAMVETSSEY